MKGVWIGCSGWSYDDWRGVLYPEDLPRRRWLEHYASVFRTVEVNNTFYRLPTREAVAGWAEQTPSDFVFAVKASRYLTHVRRLRDLDEGLKRFRERIEPLMECGKLGPLLWQLPPQFHRDDERLQGALESLGSGRHAFEFRHTSWFCRPVFEALRRHDAALVIADDARKEIGTATLTADWTFVRLHYGSRGRAGNYSRSELERWQHRIAAWRSRAQTFVYLNNDWRGFAPRNARFLASRLSGAAR